ncbi:restriction endonuclease [Alkalihalobacterium chitinilyticum]|uniref:Restriction endonuclease n=1 Tax=Alkalihalobacterium chitinilyticum TaxID=2980103 RepID=A0ABT5V9Y3_9BACI|nr:restriction endonuclease [Alkalihalobacterium chitinilyticum]MDE5412267.1 restriction endonuclease [Alkalihalobacterium chitinilyticum]
MNRGYAGFYKGRYLRSSYEYAYAKFLEHHSIPWGYEDKDFDIGYKIYKPDFFFYDEYGKVIKIVEIKSRNNKAKEEAQRALNAIKNLYNIKCELISYDELLNIYKDLPFSLTSTINEWIESDKTTVNKSLAGNLNGHYNMKHSVEAKIKIGNHTKKLWASNSEAKERMLTGLRNSGLAQKGKIKTPRETRECLSCGTNFETLITSDKKYCSNHCSGQIAIKLATEAYLNKRSSIHYDIREYIIKWSIENKDIVQATPLNKIKTTIKPLLDEIEKKFEVRDIRVVSKSVFGEAKGRKELIKFMKDISKSV